LNFFIGRTLGVAEYGTYGVVMSILLWIEVGPISGIPTAIQKFVSAQEREARAIMREAARLQFFYILILFSLSYFLAPLIARGIRDNNLTFYLRVAVWDVWIYGFYFMAISLENGRRRFGVQALLITLYSISKLLFVILFVLITHSVTGALIANIAGSVVGLGLAILLINRKPLQKGESDFRRQTLVKFAAPVALFSLIIHVLLNVDLWMVKYFLSKEAPGYYVSAATIARVPYYLFFGLSAVVLPALSNALSNNQWNRVQKTIREAMRFLFLLSIPVGVFCMVYGRGIIILFFGEVFESGGIVLQILIWGMSLMAFFFLLTTIINADNRPVISLSITGITLLVDILLNLLLVPKYGIRGAAISTTTALLIGSTIAMVWVIRRFRTFLYWKTCIRGLLSAGILYLIFSTIRVDGPYLLLMGAGCLVVYGGFLIISGEITRQELGQFKLKP
jgi:stage V sporulation protein B